MSDLLPLNATPLEKAVVNALLVNENLQAANRIQTLMDAQTVETKFLPWLAWHLKVGDWKENWTDTQKRTAILNAFQIQKTKGTIAAVKKALLDAGMGANPEINEGSTPNYFNGQVFADGSQIHGGARWAIYSILVDLGENKGLDYSTANSARKAIEAVHPARSHLNYIGFKSDIQDQVATSENNLSDVALSQSDITPWLTRYDGTQSHNQGLLITANGLNQHNGTLNYLPTATAGETALAQSDQVLSVNLQLSLSDNQRITKLFDGTVLNDGFNESELLFAEDAPMPIQVTEWHIQNGKHSYAGGFNSHNGQITAAGQAMYFGNKTYSGIKTTYLTAN